MPTGTPTVIGPYKIERELGRGGMGIVYLALDTRLGRRVAIKALPVDVAADPERLARFEREARVLASLNHPNLAAVYDVLEVEGRRYLAMEYVEGESLSDRIAREKGLPIAETLEVCAQIAAGMEAAHEGGVIHRDLKPANVMITAGERVKVVDFGLAKGRARDDEAARGHPVSPVLSSSPTLEVPATMPGVILGTAEYLSPEQARGKAVDRRTDIWSFGCILYECLTGRRLFAGETVSDSIAAILTRPLDWGALPRETPPRVRELLERCLERDPRKRLRDIGEARLVLEANVPGHAPLPSAPARMVALWRRALPVVGVLGALILAWHLFGASIRRMFAGPPPRLTHLSVVFPGVDVKETAIAPDGSRIAVRAQPRTAQGESPRPPALYTRRLDESRFSVVPGTEGVVGFAFTRDSRWIYFTVSQGTNTRLMRVPADASAPAVVIAPYGANWSGGAVLESGDLIASSEGKYYVRVHPGSPLSTPREYGIASLVVPIAALPRDRGVLLSAASYAGGSFRTGVAVLDLHSGKTRVVIGDTGFARYLAPGYLLFTRRGTLLGVRFDLAKLETRGEPVALTDGLFHDPVWSDARFDVSKDGTLCYRPGAADAGLSRLVTLDTGGRASEWSPMSAGFDNWFRVAPDGQRVACTIAAPKGLFEVFVLDRGRSSARRLSAFPDADCGSPFWSPDGREIGFTRFGRSPDDGLYVVEASGMGPPRRIGVAPKGSTDVVLAQGSWSRDGSLVVTSFGLGPTWANVGAIPMVSAGPDVPIRTLTDTPYGETLPAVSPDGKFIAYLSGESGRDEVVLSPLLPGPKLGPTTPVSSEGASEVRWGRDGSSLYYESDDHRVQSVPVQTSPTLQIGTPRTIWDLSALRITSAGWDLMPDGRLIGLQMREDEGEGKQIDLVLHFDQEVKRKVR